MNQIFLYILVIAVIVIVLLKLRSFSVKKIIKEKRPYQYKTKDHIMTESETEFFKVLVEISSDQYYVFPQVHLSAILDHKIPGQTWKYAFGHVNGKSVDYVLCDRTTLRPIYAVELDDMTHTRTDRATRDIEVERIFQGGNIALVRFSDYKSLSHQDIKNRFIEARASLSV